MPVFPEIESINSSPSHGDQLPVDITSTVQRAIAEADAQGRTLSAQGKEQLRQLALLDANQARMARLFAGLPTFDTVIGNLLVSTLKAKIPTRKLRAPLLGQIDPEGWYVNHFTTDPEGRRSLTTSERFIDVMWECLSADSPPIYTEGGVGFFTRPDVVDEASSIFTDSVDRQILSAMESVLYIASPPTSDAVGRQFREELALFHDQPVDDDSLDTTTPSTTRTKFAHLLSQRLLHLVDLYKADRNPDAPMTQGARAQQVEDDRLLGIINTHPSKADRNRLLQTPVPQAYAVMLDMGSAAAQKWPAAMVVKYPERQGLFLYSMEAGLQRFQSFQDLVGAVCPVHQGLPRTIRDISSELSNHVFEVAADDLLKAQGAALEAVFDAPENETLGLRAFAQNTENALGLPMLSLAGPLLARQQCLIEDNRPASYKTATLSQKARYRRLEEDVFQALHDVGDGVQTLWQFTRQKIKQYLRQTVHPGIDPDPDETLVTLSFGSRANPRQSRTSPLTQLMLDNLRPSQFPNAMREVLPVYLADQQGQRIRHPANGYFITLAGGELARMAVSIDAGGRYEHYLREAMNKTQYKAAWRTAYLANLKFKAYEAGLKEDEVFRATVVDKAFSPPKRQKQVALWLNAVLQSPAAASRALVSGRKVQVHGLLLGGSTGAGERHGTMGNAVSVDGVMFFSDQDGPEINGTVGVYFPDSPQGDDIHELDDLSDGITALLQQAQWQDYFRSRISTADPEEIKRTLGQRVRPLVRGVLIEDDFLEALHRAHVNFHSAYADHRSNSNREVRQQIAVRMMMVAIEVVLDLAGMLLVPGVQLLKRAVQTGALVLRTGAVPMDLGTLAFVHEVARHGTRRAARAMVVPSRGQASFLALTARPSKGGVLLGLPLEQALYRRYAVTDTALTRGFSADSQGFYRPQGSGAVYIRQPDGTVFRVHDQTRRMATEATLVDPVTGLNIRSSGVMRSTVARMPDGEWRAVGFGHGGGKRPGGKSPQPGPSKPKLPALESLDVARSIRTPGSWDNQIMDLVPAIITRLPSWPQNRSLVIIDEITPGRHWSVRFTPGETEVIYPMRAHPNETDADVLLRRMGSNHYQLVLEDRPVDIPADGDCFFNAIAQGLNEGQAQPRYSIQQLRNEAADYIDHHPELSHYLVSQPSMTHQALFDNARVLDLILDEKALLDLTRIIHGGPNTLRVFEPALNYLNTYASNLVSNQTTGAVLPAEILQMIGSFLAPRSRGLLRPKTAPLAPLERQLVQKYLEGILLGTAEPHLIAELLESRSFMLSQDLNHILLEYGLTTRQLRYNNPLSQEPYVRFDEAIHGNLDEDELEDLLDGAYLVNSDELYDLQHELRSDLGIDVRENAELFDWFKYNQAVEGIVELLEKALTRFPELRRRAEILLSSPVVALNLGGMLRVNFVANLIRNPAISDERLTLIAEYVSTRYDELLGDEHIDVDWMGLFDNRNLRSIVTRRKELTGFLSHVGGAWGVAEETDIPSIARLFSHLGQPVSDSRVALLLDTPGLLPAVQNLPVQYRWRVWAELTGPHFSDANIQEALQHPEVFSSPEGLVTALRASLGPEEARANQIIRDVFAIGQSQAQVYLHHFDFPVGRLGRSRLDFALHLESHMAIPEWAWQYARAGVTADSLKHFVAKKPQSN